MKLKYDKFGFEFTDKDTQNLIKMIQTISSMKWDELLKVGCVTLGGCGILTYMAKYYVDLYLKIQDSKAIEEESDMDQETRC